METQVKIITSVQWIPEGGIIQEIWKYGITFHIYQSKVFST